ncbi:CRISPR-associated protein [Thermococcus siculi]|uniref:CRISPR-associated protein n=1 Tax=Thermococcus siculi TaxID=72803 RepID=A0A2Z2MKB0_9EURY|nr:CRISPR-associated endonuclease Cas3'' [Thermococcus siculi]ASJ08819.1 CRISPR-associated protein [Thermococcus siculi]
MSCEAFRGQTLRQHVDAMLSAWESVKSKYIPSIIRAMRAVGIEFTEEDANRFMKAIIILHDTGKCSDVYQRHLKTGESLKGFRHELVSAYYAHGILKEIFNEEVAFIGALVVMMHHEPILMGQIRSLDREELSPEVVLDKLRNFNGVVEDTEPFIKSMMKEKLGMIPEVPSPTREDVLGEVIRLSVLARHRPDSDKLRMVVGALLIPLVLCDYKGAEEREGEAPKFAEVLGVEMML